MDAVARDEQYLAEDAGHTPHILILEVGAVAPLDDQHRHRVTARMEALGDIDLGRAMGHLAVSAVRTVDEEIETGVHPLEGQIDALPVEHGRVDAEVTDIQPRGIALRHLGRVDGIRVAHVGILRHVIAAVEHGLPGARYGHGLHGAAVKTGGEKILDLIDALIVAEIPVSRERFDKGGRPAVAAVGGGSVGVRNEVSVRFFTPVVECCERFVVVGDSKRHGSILLVLPACFRRANW